MPKLLIFLILSPFVRVAGQLPDTLNISAGQSADSLINMYFAAQKGNSPLYNGRQFYSYSSSIQGHPFYNVTKWSNGAVLYDGLWYHNIPLLYDISRDELIVNHPSSIPAVLFSERVSQFIINGEVFVYLREDKKGIIQKGFYQLLQDGKAVLYKKSFKLLEEKIEDRQLIRQFVLTEKFFVWKNEEYRPVKRQKDLLDILKDKGQELNQYKNQHNLRYKGNAEKFIVSLTQYYNQL